MQILQNATGLFFVNTDRNLFFPTAVLVIDTLTKTKNSIIIFTVIAIYYTTIYKVCNCFFLRFYCRCFLLGIIVRYVVAIVYADILVTNDGTLLF